MKYKYKITLLSAISGSIMLVLVTFFYSSVSYDEIKTNKEVALLQSTTDVASHVKNYLRHQVDVIKTIGVAPLFLEGLEKSNKNYDMLNPKEQQIKIKELNDRWEKERTTKSDFINSYLQNSISKYLKHQQALLPGYYGEIFVTNRYGAMIATTGVLSTLSHSYKNWWKESYNKRKVFFDDRGFDESVKGYVLGIVIPIKKDGQIIGILKANLNILGSLIEIVERYNSSHKGNTAIVRTKGLIVLRQGETPLSSKIDSSIIKKLETKSNGIFEMDNKLIAYAPISFEKDDTMEFGGKNDKIDDHEKGNENEIWHTVTRFDKSIILKESRSIDKILLYSGILMICILTLLSYLIGIYISRPIEKLTSIVNKFAKGEFDIESDIKSDDEVGFLSESFNNMATTLNQTMISRDELIQEIKKREKIEKQTQSLSKIVEYSSNEIYIFDKNSFRFTYVNQSVIKNLGYTLGEILDKTPVDIVSHFNLTNFRDILKQFENNGVEHMYFSSIHERKDGTTYPIDVILGQTDFMGKASYVAMIKDVTERDQMLDKMKEKDDIMVAQSRHAAMGEMISMIAHQWRQPISTIAMGANNIILDVELGSATDEGLLQTAQNILFETEHLSKTIDDFKNFFKPNKSIESIDVKEIYNEVYKIIGTSIENNDITIRTSFNTDKKIQTYSRELLQVLINIIKNAKEALVENEQEDKKIDVSVDEVDGKVVLSISDNAGGINKSIIDKVFDPYFSTKDEKTGTGLGLYMSKIIVEKHLQGKIWIENRADGVTFKISLPYTHPKSN